VNGPFGDPGLHIGLRWTGAAMQFDLGRLDRFPAAELLKLTHIFVSHTHIDHFIGFDRVMRLFLARAATLTLFGPPGIVGNVVGKLAGYTWNLVDDYPFVIEVHEVHRTHVRRVRLPAATAFAVEECGNTPFTGVLFDNPAFSVRTTHLDHKIPSLAFALIEKTHLNVRKDELERLGVPAGPWLNSLKDAIREGRPDDMPLTARWRHEGVQEELTFTLAELRDRLIVATPGQKIGYVVDTLFSRDNAARIVELVRGADVFYCEAPFADADRDQAVLRYHLTARQAGTLARLAAVERLEVFHFSPRYDGQAALLYSEADRTFRGELPADEPVEV
jgi:ribonuclease Z